MASLKYCPFCGSTDVKIIPEQDPEVGRCWYAECQERESKGTSFVECPDGHQEPYEVLEQIKAATRNAAMAWNRRVDDDRKTDPV